MSDQPPPVHVNVTQPEPSFQITLREVYNEVRTVSTKLDGFNTIPGEVADHEHRLRDIEAHYVSKASARWWFTAVVGLVCAAAAIVGLLLR